MLFNTHGMMDLGARTLGSGVVAAGSLMVWRLQARGRQLRRQRQISEEMQAYASLPVRVGTEYETGETAARLCRTISARSAFRRTAMLVRDAQGRLTVAASVGMDEAALESVDAWAASVSGRERGWESSARQGAAQLGAPLGQGSFAVVLGRMPADTGIARAIVIPFWTAGGRMAGALLVGANSLREAPRSALREALAPLEALAVKVAQAMEVAALANRLVRAEKLAGMGLLAGGMAHALNNPLTAVLGFAELIAGTAREPRLREDAGIIVQESLRMRQVVESLVGFWRPVEPERRVVEVAGLVREVAASCAAELESRGVRLMVEGMNAWRVEGNRDRLRQLLEHLLNNAAQAVSTVASGDRAIRLTVGGGGETVQVTVSDTGLGFREPGRIFDPFGGESGIGLGLSVCYGIAQEHGGEIRAYNLEPHGAAVTVELPRARTADDREVSEAASMLGIAG